MLHTLPVQVMRSAVAHMHAYPLQRRGPPSRSIFARRAVLCCAYPPVVPCAVARPSVQCAPSRRPRCVSLSCPLLVRLSPAIRALVVRARCWSWSPCAAAVEAGATARPATHCVEGESSGHRRTGGGNALHTAGRTQRGRMLQRRIDIRCLSHAVHCAVLCCAPVTPSSPSAPLSMSLLIRTPDGTALDVAPSVAVDSAKEQILFVLGRGSYGVSNAELRVSRIAAEIVRHAAGPPSPSGISIRVKGRNPLYLSPATDAAAASPIDPATLRLLSPTAGPFAWPIGATLFLLHSDGAPMMHGFQLLRSEPLIEEAEDVRPSVDPEATQDVPLAAHYLSADDAAAALPAAQDQQRSPSLRLEYGHSLTFDNSSQSQRPAHPEQSKTSAVAAPAARAAEVKPSRKRSHALAESPLPAAAAAAAASSSPAAAIAAASSQVPLSAPIAETEVCIPETEMALHTEMEVIPEEEPAEHASAAAASSSAAAPVAAAAAAPTDSLNFGVPEAGAAAADDSAVAAAAAAAAASAPSDDPPSKRARLLLVKRSLDAPPSAAPPSEFLKGWAVYVLNEGIGLKQQEILNANILKRGGVILHDFPRHGMHTIHADKKHRSSSKSRSPSPAPAAAAAAAAASSDRKLHILLIVSPSIRSRKEISDVLARRLRHDKQMAEAAHAHTHHLGIPRAAGGAGAGVGASPPTSPTLSSASTPTASPARMSLSGSSAASAAPLLRLRSQWRICHLAYLVDSNKRGQLLPVDQYVLDDEDPAAIAAANRKLDFKDDASTVSAASTTVPASAMSVAASSAAAAAAGPGAAETEFVLGGHEDDADDDEESKYADDNDPTAQLTSPAAIAAWNAPVAAHLQTTSEAYHAQSGQHFREIAFRRAAGIVRSLTFPLQSADQVKGMHGIGSGVLEEIKSVLETGKSSRLDSLKADPVLRVYQLLQTVHGVGPKIAEKLYAQGIRTLDDMRTKVKLTAQQATYLQYYDELRSPIPRGEVAVFERRIKQVLAEMDPKLRMVVCGSYRRGKDKVGDIDCLISHPDPAYRYEDEHTRRAASSVGGAKKSSFAFLLDELTRRLFAQGILTDELITPSNKFKSKVKNIYESGSEQELWGGIGLIPLDAARGWGGLHRRIDLKVYAAAEFPFALAYFTGEAKDA